ncbi:DUF6150 family protein [Hymenobacter jeollabukensis]|uniref:7(1) septoil knot domain-containing protein n=1 Tax=Hymenobacter jeollabukensis TaxID=2025313 RepID=A0A5R8WUZ9_9BACT|nr:DUF6150 family protein [Hymenobacter jeollabukensis]TLM95589.1 hypothetical protein FDY95_07340 [Hymenobacter jeollabukensis]
MLLTTFVSALLWWQPAAAAVPLAPSVTQTGGYADPCKLYGAIYLERDPRRRGFCSATVYVEQQEAFANLVVFQEANKLFADKAGLWYITDARDFADFTVLVTDNRSFADFGIYYTKVRSFAGCRKD